MLDLLLRWAPSVALTVLTCADVTKGGHEFTPYPLVHALALVGLSAALAWRGRWPAAVPAAVVIGSLAYVLVATHPLRNQPSLEPFLLILVAVFLFARHTRSERAGMTLALLVVGEEVTAIAAGRPAGDVVPPLFIWSIAAVVGVLQRLVAERAARAEAQARDTEQAIADERSRLARELHDVVVHGLSVIVIQASVEARVAEAQGQDVTVLRTVERTARESLTELRRLLGLMRRADVDAPLEPMPSLADLPDLVERTRAAGLPVSLTVTGDAELPAGLELSAYRIVQEGLTNVMAHAAGASTAVEVRRCEQALEVEVRNGPGTPGPRGGGHGLIGMQERVNVYGGKLTARPSEDGGFLVHAVLPR